MDKFDVEKISLTTTPIRGLRMAVYFQDTYGIITISMVLEIRRLAPST